jgi:hypothetical protein
MTNPHGARIRRATPLASWPLLGLLALGCGDAHEAFDDAETAQLSQAAIFGTDDREPMNSSYFNANPNHRGIGLWQNPDGHCTGTKVYGNYVLSGAHCVEHLADPTAIWFYPALIHSPTDPDHSNEPRIRGKRLIRGTGVIDRLGNVVYEAGADWAILEVDSSSFENGSASYPTWSSYPSIELSLLTSEPNNLVVSALGYSEDLYVPTSGGYSYGAVHEGCHLKKDSPEYAGLYLSDCDWRKGASGGPILRSSDDALVALLGGEQGYVFPAYSDEDANFAVETPGVVWAPWKPIGIAAAKDSSGKAQVYASDSAFPGQVATRKELSAGGAFQRWDDFRSGSALGSAGRMSALRVDGHQFVFAISGSSAQVYANWETSTGVWNGWAPFFSGDTQSSSAIDVASSTAGSVVLYQYVLRSTSTYARRKTGSWTGPWSSWQTIGYMGSGARAISAENTGGYPVLVGITGSAVKIKWGNDTAGDSWVSWQDFGDGLPSGYLPIDIEIGTTTDGKLDVFLLMRTSPTNNPGIYRRTKVTAEAGSAWGNWLLYRQHGANPELRKATALTLLPPHSSRGDGLVIISDGNVFASGWTSSGTFRDFLPFYGPGL